MALLGEVLPIETAELPPTPNIQVAPGFCKSSTELIVTSLEQTLHSRLGESLPMCVKHL